MIHRQLLPRSRHSPTILTMAALAMVVCSATAVSSQDADAVGPPETEPLPDTTERLDPIARLQQEIDAGALSLPHDSAVGYLPGLLDALGIPVSSQGLIFSRTSLQTDGIAPWAPRAVYFNDDVYVGYVQESSFLEIASVHPTEGGVFYTLSQGHVSKPTFQREGNTCLMCHESRSMTGGVPGFIMRSVLTDRLGYVITDTHDGPTTDRTPLESRWGGWYVTGTHGDAVHSGNTKASGLVHEIADKRRYLDAFDLGTGGNLVELGAFFDPSAYISSHSDIVALMVLGHQVQIHNVIAMAHASTREALRDQRAMRLSGRATTDPDALSPTARARIRAAADRLVREMFMSRAAALPAPVRGTSGFAEEWVELGPRDSRGRSLRDFDLESRLFRYPLSFLVYSDAFQALPPVTLGMVYEGIAAVLSGREEDHDDFRHLSADDRTHIEEILLETLPGFRIHVSEERSR